jgi:pimeloyl-ACP methyl ester carboxylesterase
LTVTTTAGSIEYGEQGPGNGVPVLASHGGGTGWYEGLSTVANLVPSNFRIVAPSRFGYLGTPMPAEASPAAQADAHAALLTACHIPRAIVVGISAGARSAAEMAIRYPDRVAALILIVPGTYAPSNTPVTLQEKRTSPLVLRLINAGADFGWWAMERVARATLIRFVGVPPAVYASASKADKDAVLAIVRSVQPLSARLAGMSLDATPELLRPAYEKISAPTLVISARDDLFNTLPGAEFAAATIPNAQLIVYDSGGHLLIGHERELRDAVRHFLSDLGMIRPSELT